MRITKTLIYLFIVQTTCFFSQEKIINSKVNSATIFLSGAQISRTKTVQITQGENLLRFVNLSPFIDKRSIQIKAPNIEIESIEFKKDFLKKKIENTEKNELNTKLTAINSKIDIKQVELETVIEEISFLKSNKSIGGKNQNLSVNILRDAASFYGTKMKSLKTKELSIKTELKKLRKEQNKIANQISDQTSLKNFGSGEIIINLNSSISKSIVFELSYIVSNVSWKPSYDIKVKDIDSPLQLVYKASLKQNSQIDWKNIKLKFSSANPTNSSKVKKIIPYFIDFGTYPPNYNVNKGTVSGKVSDASGGLPGVSILVKGTTIGTETDFDGNYTLQIPSGRQTLVYSYLGYETTERTTYGGNLNIILEENSEFLDEVVVASYGKTSKRKKELTKKLQGNTPGVSVRGKRSITDITLKSIKIDRQTSVEFEVDKPYSINSSNKDVSIPMKSFVLNANYKYYSLPKVDLNAYLVASISNWEEINLLEAEANIYFEDTFLGTSLLDIRESNKNLDISLGVDKNVQIKRSKEKDYTTKQFIGNKQDETRIWNFFVKNNKSKKINITILDQIPISKTEDIKINLDTKATGGIINKETGEIKWNFNVLPKQSKKLKLKYSVRYPKGGKIFLD